MRHFWPTRPSLAAALIVINVNLVILQAQNSPPLGVMYSCNSGSTKLKITQCAGGRDMMCDVQFFGNSTPPEPTGSTRVSREQLVGMLRSCVLPNGQPAIGNRKPAAATKARPAISSSAGAPLKVGDTVQVYYIFGWTKVVILAIKGDQVRVRYPDNQEIWVQTKHLRRISGTALTAHSAASQSSGLSSCAGKLEGTYGDRTGLLSIVFRLGKARVTPRAAEAYEADCRMLGDRIVLRGTRPQDILALTLKPDGTLENRQAGTLTRK